MTFHKRITPGRKTLRPLAASLTLAAYLVVALGVPVAPPTPEAAAQEATATPHRGCCCGPNSCNTQCCCARPGRSARTTEADAPPPAPRWGTTLSALQCKGLSTLWVSAGCVLPPPLAADWTPDAPTVAFLPFDLPTPPKQLAIPPTPPPRQVA
jgi:hypothetical protein